MEKTFWLIIVYGDVEPELYGPYTKEEYRDISAKSHRKRDPDINDGIYKLTIIDRIPTVEPYSGGFFE